MKALLFLFLLLPFINIAQRARQNVVYDVVKLQNGQILYGKMIALDNNYVLTFKDIIIIQGNHFTVKYLPWIIIMS
jgi:small nuclear ribonucleoprotein (snRNP)-like protein